MSTYINRGAELVFAPPFLAENVSYYGFLLEADRAKLQGVVDRTLNEPLGRPGAFSPAGEFVLLACCALPSLRSTAPGYDRMGCYAENEVAFWLPVIDHKRARLLWLFPYIWVDNPFAMAMGRELYGFPKGLGTIGIPNDPKKPEEFSLTTQGVRTFGPEAEAEMIEVVTVTHGGSGEEDSLFSDIGKMVETMIHELEDAVDLFRHLRLALHTLEDLVHLRMPMVFLREFRDIADPERTCYQKVIETMPGAKKIYGGRIYRNDFEVTITPCDSAPIARDLGLPAGPIKPTMAFYMNFDFEIGTGEEVG